MTTLLDKEQLAIDYVLGTMDYGERKTIEALSEQDTELANLIEHWQKKMAPLLETVAPVTPSSNLFDQIQNQLPNQSQESSTDEVSHMRRKLARWRAATVSATAMAAVLATVIFVSPALFRVSTDPFVAVFQQDDQQPAFLMSVDLNSKELTVRPITAEGQIGKTYQLWIVAEQLGSSPKSLGLVESLGQPTYKTISLDAEVLKKATFGISIEPQGGSPTGQPTGPAIHGQLNPASI